MTDTQGPGQVYRGKERRASGVYPMMRRKRRPWKRRSVRLRLKLFGLLGGIALAMTALILLLLNRGAPPVDPVAAMRRASIALETGNYHAAHDQARRAAAALPRSADAQMLLARTSLLLDEGVTAAAALDRAQAAGVPLSRTLAMRVESLILQGDLEGAQDAVDRMPEVSDADMRRARARLVQAREGNDRKVRAILAALVTAYPGDARGWTDLGRSRFGAGDMSGAAAAAQRAVALAPADPAALTLRGEIVRARYGLIAALPWFRAALQRDAYYHPALIKYAATLGDNGQASAALAASRAALVSRPGSPQAYFIQAVIAARAGRYGLAQHLLQLTGGRLRRVPAGELLEGALAYAQGRPQLAVRAWGRLVTMQPMNVAARQLLAAAQIDTGDRAAASATLSPIVARPDAEGYALRLAARAAAGRDDGAAAGLLDRAARGQPGRSTVFLPDQSAADLLAQAAQTPDDPTYAIAVLRALASTGRGAVAVARAQALVRASPGAPAAQLALGDVLSGVGRMPEAITAYARAADLTFDEPTMLRLVEGYGRTARTRDAAVGLGLYLSQNPQSVAARRLLGQWQLRAGTWDAAIETLEGLRVQMGSHDVALIRDLALAYAGAGDGVVARRYGALAYRLAPMNAAVADAYGVALMAAGEGEGARQLFDKALALAPGDPAIMAHRAAL
ncbi:tetratricopeptide repeat protein [Sphingomonadaceae bacterium jetA1]|uniref:tetratricopeptide repeat protein n=1 Tax=Facivitalis istanbulensis TaxID=3075838 RepID=UPI00347CF16E